MTETTYNQQTYKPMSAFVVLAAMILCSIDASIGLAQPYTMRAAGFTSVAGSARSGNYQMTYALAGRRANKMQGDYFYVNAGIWSPTSVCIVEFDDFARFAELWSISSPESDIDHSGNTDFGDLAWLAHWWLDRCPTGWQLE